MSRALFSLYQSLHSRLAAYSGSRVLRRCKLGEGEGGRGEREGRKEKKGGREKAEIGREVLFSGHLMGTTYLSTLMTVQVSLTNRVAEEVSNS